jgi:hypothetical protein
MLIQRSNIFCFGKVRMWLWLPAVLFLMSGRLDAQKTDVGAWYVYMGNQALSKKWNWWNEVQFRNYDMGGDLQQLLLRTGLGYNLTENNNNVLLGYAYIFSENYEAGGQFKLSNHENRIYQQYLTKQQFGRLTLQHRYRIEERFLENDFRWRFRYSLSMNMPITSQTMAKGVFYLVASNELFLHGDSPAFDRNRVYGGIGYIISSHLRCEAGVIRQTLENSYRDQIQVVVQNTLPVKG